MNLNLKAFESKDFTFRVEGGSSEQYVKVMLPKEMHTTHKLYSPRDHNEVLAEVTVVGWCYDNGMPCRAYYKKSEYADIRHAEVYGRPCLYLVENED